MKRFFRSVLELLVRHEVFVLALGVMILLRIPNLFEPYWYGDEGIYLTLGVAMRNGLILYKEIIDHKTPIIYLFAMLPTQFWFKLFFLFWMVMTSVLWYVSALRLRLTKLGAMVGAIAFLVVTTLPWFEGHIANGELFVAGFVLAGFVVFSYTGLFKHFLSESLAYHTSPKLMYAAGFLYSLGVLTKVPGVFDLAALAVVFGMTFLRKPSSDHIKKLFIDAFAMVIGILSPILLSIGYFAWKDALAEYAQFGLIYNFRYSKSFSVPVANQVLAFLYTMPGKAMIVVSFAALTLLLRKKLTPQYQLVLNWMTLALFSSLLSSRPYPHYFLQFFPPAALAVGLLISHKKKLEKTLTVVVLFLFVSTLVLLKAGLYQTYAYYENFVRLVTHQKTKEEYRQWFNPLMNETYRLAERIVTTTNPSDRIFIWGTNPMLYALAQRSPAGRFTVSFHIKDFDAYQETIEDIREHTPPVIVVMKNEDGAFPEFSHYLAEQYMLSESGEHMDFYRRVNWK